MPIRRVLDLGAEKEWWPLVFAQVDVDENEETAAACSVSAMPTFKFYKGGQEVKTIVGA